MKKAVLVLLLVLFAVPTLALAHCGSCDMGEKTHGQGDAGMQMLPEQTVDGVKAMVHLKDVKAAMAKMGMTQTHHFMIMLSDAKTGKEIVPAQVAVKITDPAGKEGAAVALMAMQGHAGADVTLGAPGEYTFKVVAVLADGRKVPFQFKAAVK